MIYALADLHLDYTKNKSMDVFGDNWINYEQKIFDNWQKIISDKDTVLIAGDISWAMKEKEAFNDLKRIDKLKGRKILLKGNHDYWWQSLNKINQLGLKTISFLQNNSFEVEGYSICGTRGRMREGNNSDEHDKKIFRREILRLRNSLESARLDKKIVMLHYPPIDFGEFNEFFDILKQYQVSDLVYGHLHGSGHKLILEGVFEGINVKCVSGDYVDFKAQRII